MKLYLLKRTDDVGYDENDGGVVRASSPRAARKSMAALSGGENRDGDSPWMDTGRSTCLLLLPNDKPEVVLASFRAG